MATKAKPRKELTEEQLQVLRDRLALARAKNPNNTPALRTETPPEDTALKTALEDNKGVKQYFSAYLEGYESIQDFKALRRKNPERALEIAMDRAWGRPSAIDPTGANKRANKGLAILIQVLSGQKDTPQHVVPERYIPEGDTASATEIIVKNQEVE